jgi:dolichyl-phosphate beta-glucosyltransferase
MDANTLCVVAITTRSTAALAARRQSVETSAPGYSAANAFALSRFTSQQIASRHPPSDRARLRPTRPHPIIATLKGIDSPPVRIIELCDVSLILPAYNEAPTIAATIQEAGRYFRSRGLRHEIIVAADGDDGTRERAAGTIQQGEPVRVIGNRERSGKGRGVRDAMALAAGEICGYADADNKVPIEEFDRLRPFLSQGYDVVIGSRAMRESQIERRQPLYRQLGGKGFGIFMHAVVGLAGITDTQCGFKFFTHAAACEVFRRQRIDGYMFDVEILVLACRLGYRIQQVPIRWHDDGDSRLNLVSGNLRNLVDIFRIRAGAAHE